MRIEDYRDQAASLEFGQQAFSIDQFSYCRGGAEHSLDDAISEVDGELPDLDRGYALEQLLSEAESIAPPPPALDDTRAIEAEGFRQLFPAGDYKSLTVSHTKEGMSIQSSLESQTSQYLYSHDLRSLSDFGFRDEAKFFLDVSAGTTLQSVFIFFDSDKKRISHTIDPSLTNHIVEVPANAAFVRFGIHCSGPGQVTIRRLVLGIVHGQDPVRIFGKSRVLVLTNQYPSSDDLYRNAFVHKRVLGYKERGLTVDVFRMRKGQLLSYHDFEGIPVISGGERVLSRLIETNEYETVAVHFLDESMWSILKNGLSTRKTIVWVHGADISSWKRREHNYTTQEERIRAIERSEARDALWTKVVESLAMNLRLVFVSRCLADEAQEDLALQLPDAKLEVIHNLIDDALFSFETKNVEQRKRILSIRPFASRTYANDLSVDAILALSTKHFFNELEFRIIGDGPLFEKVLEPLRGFSNVQIERGFLSQREIADLHKDYGVFLVPTRADSQGVSRDEAMASGLVPITNAVSAIPEFVDDTCALLAPPEDAGGLADAIEKLYNDPELFLRLSGNAAKRVRKQSGPEQTIARELALLSSDSTPT